MSNVWAWILCLLQIIETIYGQEYYTIISPGTIHPNSEFSVAVNVQNVTEMCKIRLSVDGPRFGKEVEVDVEPSTVKNVKFLIPNIKQGDYFLNAKGLTGIIFFNSSQLNFADNSPSVYVQTDKATYKPGDLTQFRVIVLDQNMRPSKIDKPISINIKDAAYNRIKQYNNLTITKGVFTESLQLSDFAMLGNWQINVEIDGQQFYSKKFEVAKYVLPKVQILMDVPKKISLQDEIFGFTVQAKYTFGKPVRGKAIIRIKSFKSRDVTPVTDTSTPSYNSEEGNDFNSPMPYIPGVVPSFNPKQFPTENFYIKPQLPNNQNGIQIPAVGETVSNNPGSTFPLSPNGIGPQQQYTPNYVTSIPYKPFIPAPPFQQGTSQQFIPGQQSFNGLIPGVNNNGINTQYLPGQYIAGTQADTIHFNQNSQYIPVTQYPNIASQQHNPVPLGNPQYISIPIQSIPNPQTTPQTIQNTQYPLFTSTLLNTPQPHATSQYMVNQNTQYPLGSSIQLNTPQTLYYPSTTQYIPNQNALHSSAVNQQMPISTYNSPYLTYQNTQYPAGSSIFIPGTQNNKPNLQYIPVTSPMLQFNQNTSQYPQNSNANNKTSKRYKRNARSSGTYYNPFDIEEFYLEKTLLIKGKEFVEYKISELIPNGKLLLNPTNIEIMVSVEEDLTGNKYNATSQVEIVQYKHILHPDELNVQCDHLEETFMYTVRVTNILDEPVVADKKEPVIFKPNHYGQSLPIHKAFLNESGIAAIELDCHTYNTTNIRVEYKGAHAEGRTRRYIELNRPFMQQQSSCNVMVLKPSVNFNEDVAVEMNTEFTFHQFVYAVIGRGNIITTELVTVPRNNARKAVFLFKPTFEMIPKSKIFVYFVVEGNLKFCETEFSIERDFENTISISAPTKTAPGSEISLKLETDLDSYVGLLAVDQSVLLLKTGNDFDVKKVLEDSRKFKTETPTKLKGIGEYPGENVGLITMTNAHFPYYKRSECSYAVMPGSASGFSLSFPATGMSAGGRTLPSFLNPLKPTVPPVVRKQFLETWFFDDIPSYTQKDMIIKKHLPDTITSWIVTGFSMNEKSGFAQTKNPTKITTFRSFFITTNLPYAVKRGEQISIPVIIFNYLDKTISAEVTLENEFNEFDFVESECQDVTKCTKQVIVDTSGETITFTLQPKILGHITLKIIAISFLAGDAISKKLKVEPEGVTVYKNRDYYLRSLSNKKLIKELIKLDVPSNVVPDSEHIEISVMGNILGSTITNLDGLVRLPAGCGEQNMVNFVPNILVLRYLESIQQLSPAIAKKAKNYLDIGYQRELTYGHEDGSYSAFGKSDKSGSTWLTAYVMRSFHQAAKYIDIDKTVMDKGLRFLADVQASNGSFPEIGKVLDFSHFNDVGLTAFVLLAFLENVEYVEQYKDVIERGFVYLEENIKQTDDLYALSIAVYALQLHKSSTVPEILKKLDADAKLDGGLKWWTKSVAELRPDQAWRPKSHDVEVTGYILMTLLDMNRRVIPITKWLVAQRNSNGGFSSTQETVVGLQALIKFAERSSGGRPNMEINVGLIGDDSILTTFDVNSANSLIMQTLVLPNEARDIAFSAVGTGAAILQVSYRYNIIEKELKPSFSLKIDISPTSNSDKLLMTVCAEFVPILEAGEHDESNMAVMEIGLPSGYVTANDDFQSILDVDGVKRVETKNSNTNLVVYFDSLKAFNIKCIPVEAELEHAVTGQKPVPVVIYDYYDNTKRCTEFYEYSVV